MPLIERRLPAAYRSTINRRKRAPKGVFARTPEGHSLDSFKHLATSEKSAPKTLRQELKEKVTAIDRHRRAYHLYERLLDTMKALIQAEGMEDDAQARTASADRQRRYEVDLAQRRVYEAAYDAAVLSGYVPDHVYPIGPAVRVLKPKKRRQWSASKDYARLSGCQSEWIGYKPECCGGKTVAIPVGCNHRLCPLCNNHRAMKYRKSVEGLFGELGNPQLLTLTVPSPRYMTRDVLDTLRKRCKAFLKLYRPLMKGGVMSIEVTYNAVSETWHPHVHMLVDIDDPRERIPYEEFRMRKWRIEFDWLVVTQGKNKRWKAGDFDKWMAAVQPQKPRDKRMFGANCDRRIVDLRNVTKDKKAAYEVMKYMSKAASFIGSPAALKQLLVAIRGVRQIQTFGSCYGFKLEPAEPTSHMKCECGGNDFHSIGRLGLGMVKLSPEGTWYVRDDAPVRVRHRCRGKTTYLGGV